MLRSGFSWMLSSRRRLPRRIQWSERRVSRLLLALTQERLLLQELRIRLELEQHPLLTLQQQGPSQQVMDSYLRVAKQGLDRVVPIVPPVEQQVQQFQAPEPIPPQPPVETEIAEALGWSTPPSSSPSSES